MVFRQCPCHTSVVKVFCGATWSYSLQTWLVLCLKFSMGMGVLIMKFIVIHPLSASSSSVPSSPSWLPPSSSAQSLSSLSLSSLFALSFLSSLFALFPFSFLPFHLLSITIIIITIIIVTIIIITTLISDLGSYELLGLLGLSWLLR